MSAISLVVGAHKGGVGKTTTAYNVACALAYRGHKVLSVDLDSQGNLTFVLRVKRYPGVVDALRHDYDLSDVARTIDPSLYSDESNPQGLLVVLGSNTSLSLPEMIDFVKGDPFLLGAYLEPYRDYFDYIVIDTPPTHSPYHSLAYRAADYVLIPTEMTGVSLMSMSEVMAAVREVQLQHQIEVVGVLPNKVSRNKDDLGVLDQQRGKLGELLWPEIYESAVWAKAFNRRRPLYLYVDRSMHRAARRAVKEMWEVVDRVEALNNG
jgi:chromosome partitioning protein